jgi:hypothetical protein
VGGNETKAAKVNMEIYTRGPQDLNADFDRIESRYLIRRGNLSFSIWAKMAGSNTGEQASMTQPTDEVMNSWRSYTAKDISICCPVGEACVIPR